MKKTLCVMLIGCLFFSFSSNAIAWANSSFSQTPVGNYVLEYQYEFVNSSKQPVDQLTVKGLSLSQDNSAYYSLIGQNTDGIIEEKDGMSFFKKEFEKIKEKTTVKYTNTYNLQLDTIQYSIDASKVQPLQNNEDLQVYLKPESYIESEYPLIKGTAQQLTGSESNPYIKARILFEFVATQMRYNLDSPIKNTGSINAIEDIQKAGTDLQQGGVCYDYATLYAALLRSQGIPARVISGFKITPFDLGDLDRYKKIDIIYNLHAWVEFYLEPYGWVFADPTIDSVLNMDQIFQNFAQTENLYIKKGYNLPYDILEYTITSDNKSDMIVRQSAILKRNKEQTSSIGHEEKPNEAGPENENPSTDFPDEDKKENRGTQSINIRHFINYRKKNVNKIIEYRKAKQEYQMAEEKEDKDNEVQQEKKDKEKKIAKKSSEASVETKDKEENLNIFQRIIQFFIHLFNKLF